MKFLTRALPVAAVAACALPGAAQAATHTIRVEGESRTLLAETQATVPDAGDIPGTGGDCQWTEPAGPLEQATGGSWNRARFVTTILGESHTSSTQTSWYVFTNGKISNGACDETLAGPTEIVFGPATYDPATGNPAELPTWITEAPATVAPGQAFRVRVVEPNPQKDPTYGFYIAGTGTPHVPAQGVTVTAGGATATTGADGYATLTVGQAGATTIAAGRTMGLSRAKPQALCVSATGDCGAQTAAPPSACQTTGADGLCGTRDRVAPRGLLTGIKDRQVFARGKGPRVLRGKAGAPRTYAPDPSGLHAVKLRLTRTDRGRCSTWSKSKERFVRRRCGVTNGWWFAIGTDPSWEYQLAERLPRGRYVLDVNAIDKAYNRDDERRRGENRAIFTVR